MADKEVKNLGTEKLKKNIYGKDYKDDNIDDIIGAISDKLVNKNFVNHLDSVRKAISTTIDNQYSGFNNIMPTIMNMWENRDRLFRYANAEEITENISYCARALQVLSDEIISPDDFTKDSIQVLPGKTLNTDDDRDVIDTLTKLKDLVNVEDYIFDIVHDTLKFGDQFVEIYNQNSEDVPFTQAVLTEREMLDSNKKEKSVEEPKEYGEFLSEDTFVSMKVFNDERGEYEEKRMKINLRVTELSEAKKKKKDEKGSKEKDSLDANDVKLLVHDPRFVVKLQSRKYKLCIGYLVLPYMHWYSPSFSQLGGARTYGSSTSQGFTGYSYSTDDNMVGIDSLYKSLVNFVKNHFGDEVDVGIDKKELKELLKRAISEVEETTQGTLNIRYVPIDRMQHFYNSNRKFFPYGESIFQKTMFQAKLLIALMTALTIKRLSDSTDKRIIYVEYAGDRAERNRLEEVKQSLQKKRYSLDTFGSLSSIPSMLTTFETIFIPQKNGRRPIEFDRLEPTFNVQQLSEELKFFRDTLVASLDVPPSYVGLEENTPGKNPLNQENNVFARTIVSYQKKFAKHMKSLLVKVYKYVYKKNLELDFSVVFPPPRFLQTELVSDHVSSVVTTVENLERLNIPKDYSKKKFLNIVDWDEIDKFIAEKQAEDAAKGKDEEEGQDDFGGGFGPGGY